MTVPFEKAVEIEKKLHNICKENFPYGYDIYVGAFTKVRPTVTDYLKYGEGFEGKIDPRLIGMVDPNAKLSNGVKMIKGD